jgi:Squalene-hopene cyclase N-terminal domain/Prenyltransferase and squalene oxidase repeat
MTGFLLLSLVAVPAQAPTDPAPAPTPADVRKAVERSLPYLLKSSREWREDRKCVTCHQVPFAVWPLNEARARGLAVEGKDLDGLTAWSLDFCTTNKREGEFTGGGLSTMGKLVLALGSAPRTDKVVEAYEFFEPLIAKRQQPDGSWTEGSFAVVNGGGEKEAAEVDTMWTVLALDGMEKQAGEKLSAKARESLAKNRERALAFLKDAKPATRTDWLALRMLVEKRNGDAKGAERWREALLERQGKDGGWPFVKDGPGHPLVTGEVLYALSVLGMNPDEPAVVRARTFLLQTQQEDGSWKALSRAALAAGKPDKVSDVATHWGTGWATIGLVRTLPR